MTCADVFISLRAWMYSFKREAIIKTSRGIAVREGALALGAALTIRRVPASVDARGAASGGAAVAGDFDSIAAASLWRAPGRCTSQQGTEQKT